MERIRATIWFLIGWSYLVLVFPWFLRAKYLNYRGRVEDREKIAHKTIRLFSRILIYATGSTVEISGIENIPKESAVIFASNHPGHVDSLVIEGFIYGSKGYLAIDDFEKTPILGTWMKFMGSVFIDRKNMRKSLLSIQEAVDNLNRGHSMVIFPEGRLNDGDNTVELQTGWVRIVMKSGLPIVPITIQGTNRVLSYDGKRINASKIHCNISKPICTADLRKEDVTQFLYDLRTIINEFTTGHKLV